MATQKSIMQEVAEVNNLIQSAAKAIEALAAHPAYERVMEFGINLEAFTMGQPKPIAEKPAGVRKRRTPAQIEADKLAASNVSNGKAP